MSLFNQAAAEIEISIKEDSQVVKLFNDIYIPGNKTVNGEVVSIFGDIRVEGRVMGDVVAVLGDVKVNNVVGGEVVSVLGSINRGPEGEIRGGLAEVGASHLIGDIDFAVPFFGFLGLGFKLMKMVLIYGLAVLVIALLPQQEQRMIAAFKENNLSKVLFGLIALVLWPILTLVAVISIVGIPLVPLIVLSFFLIKFIGYVAVALFIGNRIKRVGKLQINVFVELLLGVIILGLISSIPVLGVISYLAVAVLSLGVVIETKFGTGNAWFNTNEFQKLSESIANQNEENND